MSSRVEIIQELFEVNAMTQRLMHGFMHRAFVALGVAPSQVHLLNLIENMQPVSLKKLAEAMHLTPGAITQLVDSLVQVGYVDREPSTQDRRVSVVTLTDTAREKIHEVKRVKERLLTEVVTDLDDEELQTFLHVQLKIQAYLENACPQTKSLMKKEKVS